jgi:hypothetical protein
MNRRALLAAFLAAPAAVKLAPWVRPSEGWEVVDTGEWFPDAMAMLAAYGFVFEHHHVRIHGDDFRGIVLGECPEGTRIICNYFGLAA